MSMGMGGHGGHMMSSGMTMQLDRRTVGGRVMGTWQWQDVKLESGLDTQTNTHRSMNRGNWEKDAQFNSYGAFSELTWSTSEQDKLIGGARLDRTWWRISAAAALGNVRTPCRAALCAWSIRWPTCR